MMADSKTQSRTFLNTPNHNEPPGGLNRTISNTTQISMAAALRTEPSLTTTTTTTVGRPQEQLQLDNTATDDENQYPKGAQLWLNMLAVLLISFLRGLDTTIIAVAVPKLTDQFKTVADIGWYSAVYGLIMSSTCFFFGKMYTMFDMKRIFIASVAIFELGSIVCTFAPSSKVFIMGRALTGFGAAGQGAGTFLCVSKNFPNHKRPVVNGIVGFSQSIGLCSAPIIGGALTDAFTWRACFGINVPIGVVAILILAFTMVDVSPNPNIQLPFREKVKKLDIIGTLFIVPSIVCLMMGLQWGGNTYGWSNPRVIALFVAFAVLVVGFGYVQYRQQEEAVLPLRILKNRTVLAGALFSCCINGVLAVTEFYISVYFQGVRGYSATTAGILGLPMIVGLAVASISAAFGTSWLGYYSPFMFATGVLGPIAAGVLTTIDLNDSKAKVSALLGLLGFAMGLSLQAPVTAVMTVMSPGDVSIALGIIIFGAGMGSSLFVAVSAALFHDRLRIDILSQSPGMNITGLGDHGLADLRNAVGPARLHDVLVGYNEAVVQTLYLPLALALLAILGAVFTEIRSVKKKRE